MQLMCFSLCLIKFEFFAAYKEMATEITASILMQTQTQKPHKHYFRVNYGGRNDPREVQHIRRYIDAMRTYNEQQNPTIFQTIAPIDTYNLEFKFEYNKETVEKVNSECRHLSLLCVNLPIYVLVSSRVIVHHNGYTY